MKRTDLPKLPDNPGVYRWLDNKGEILYIGRATSLRDRVRSYFGKNLIAERGPHLVDMVTRSTMVEFTETPTVLDAILLESELIHRFKPYYNTKEKDDRSGACIIITKEELPRIFVERERTYNAHKDVYKGAQIFGPFPSSKTATDILRFLRRSFPFFDRKASNKNHSRFYAQLGLSPGQTDSEFQKRYRKTIGTIARILHGDRAAVVTELTEQMKTASQKTDYELAARLRDTIRGLSRVPDTQFIVSAREQIPYERIEAYDTSHMSGRDHVGVMVVLENGEPVKSEYRSFIIRKAGAADDIAATIEILSRRLQHSEWRTPNLIVIDGGSTHLAAARTVIPESIQTLSVVKDDRHKAREILGGKVSSDVEKAIILANSEAHRFSKKVMMEKFTKPIRRPKKS